MPIDLPVPLKEKMLPTFRLGRPNEIAVHRNCAVNHTRLREMPFGSKPVVYREIAVQLIFGNAFDSCHFFCSAAGTKLGTECSRDVPKLL